MPQNRYFIALDTPGTPRRMHARSLPLLAGLVLGGLVASPPAAAWGDPAHRVVAHLAQAQLLPGAEAEVARLLAGEARPDLAAVATWADAQREDGGRPGRRSRRWHYVDFESGPGCEYAPARDCPDGDCVVAAIGRESARLADRALPDAERAEALKYLVHLVADVHQPLHASPMGDKGGLEFQVESPGKGKNLHLVWDVDLLERALASTGQDEAAYARALREHAPPPPPPSPSTVDEWAQESCRLVRDGDLYPSSHRLDLEYLDAHRAQMDARLRLAGARLADLINGALEPSEEP